MKLHQTLLVASVTLFSASVAMAAGEKCYNKADGTENAATSKKDCKAAKGTIWARHAPKAKGDMKASATPPAAGTTPATTPPAGTTAPAGGATP